MSSKRPERNKGAAPPNKEGSFTTTKPSLASSKAPPTSTKAPPTSTKAPPTSANAPPTSAKVPRTTKQIPASENKGGQTSTNSTKQPLPTLTIAPPTSTKASSSSTKAPPTSTSAPSTSSKVPPTNKPSLSATVNRLQSDNPKKVVEALVLIRKCFIKEKTGTDRLRHYGGVEALLSIIQGTNNKQKDIALSIMGNICMDPKVQKKVFDLDGIATLGEVVKKCDDVDMTNRACRTLANLAQDPECCAAIHDCEELLAAYVNHLNKTEDENLQLTIIRALRILSDTNGHRQAVLEEEGLRAVASSLKSESSTVIKATYQCLTVLTKKFSIDCARQIVAADAPASVIKLTEHEDKDISKTAFTLLLLDWMNHEEMRVGIGNAGGVVFFIKHLEQLKDQRKRLILANALCLSCQEVVNRVRVKDNNGLQIMLKLLQDPDFVQLHDRLITALTCFLYDDDGFETMLKNGIVSVIVTHLKRVAHITDIPFELRVEEDELETWEASEEQDESAALKDCDKIDENKDTNVKPEPANSGRETLEENETARCMSDPKSQVVDNEYKSSRKKDRSSEKKEEEHLKPISEESGESSDNINEIGDEKDLSKNRSLPRYSLDSPTYKSVIEWQVEDYSQGPKNLLDSQLYYEQASSPGSPGSYSSLSHPGPYSPLSLSSYGSYDCSPDTSPCPKVRCLSPNLSSFEGSNSPEYMSLSSGMSPNVQDSPCISPGPSSPTVDSEPGSPLVLPSTTAEDWIEQDMVRFYSSDEEDFDKESDLQFKSLLKEGTVNQELLNLDTLSPPSTSSSSIFRMNSDNSDTETSTSDGKSVKSIKRTPLSTRQGQKRKRDLTPEMRKKILLSVERSTRGSSSSIDLSEMLSSKVLKFEQDVPSQKECPADKRDFRKHVEYCLIMLLKRISYGSDPSDYLIKTGVMATMLDYIRLASEPYNKCGRILIRLTKNPKCFERLLYEMMPALVHRKLHSDDASMTSKKEKESQKSSTERPKKLQADFKKQTSKPTEVIHRSMSACTLKESQKAVRFHKEVLKQTESPQSDAFVDNAEDSLQLKNTLFSNVSLMAESPFGQGVIDHVLNTGTLLGKSKVAVSLAYVCRSRSLLVKTFIERKGFLPLFSAIKQEKSQNLQQYALEGLICLVSAHLKEPPHPPKHPSSPAPSSPSPTQPLHDIIFTFDDGSTIPGQRSILVKKSEVFAAMLEGHYSESKQSEVHMPDVTNEAFQIIIDYFHGENKSLRSDSKFSVVIESYRLAHRFMLDDLLSYLEVNIADQHLSLENIEEVLSHAVLHGARWLTIRCLLFMLVNRNKGMDRHRQMFRKVLLELTADFFMDIFQ